MGNGHRPGASTSWRYANDGPVGNRIGVAMSGGGIRSASFGLGALQHLQHAELLERCPVPVDRQRG